MKKNIFLLFFVITSVFQSTFSMPATPDSAYVFAYSTLKNGGRGGLHLAWSTDRKQWHAIGPEMRFLFCDYGRWGSQKRLVNPFLTKDSAGNWHCIWSVNENDNVFAYATSKDLVYWKPQIYPEVAGKFNCLDPEISVDNKNKHFQISWLSDVSGQKEIFGTSTSDFKIFALSSKKSMSSRLNLREKIRVNGNMETGTVNKVSWDEVDFLLKTKLIEDQKRNQNDESAITDPQRYEGLKPFEANVSIDIHDTKKISDMLIGIFFEDINYAADGGLYAELIQNRDFEYHPADKEFRDISWNSKKSWNLKGENATFEIDTVQPIHYNNPNYAVLKISKPGSILVNEGFNGIFIKKGEKYDISSFIRNIENGGQIIFRLTDGNGRVIGQTVINNSSKKWKKVNAVILANADATDANLEIIPQFSGTVHLDMVSLFPQKTFKNRKNGLRADLAQTIADLHPRFVRFPGGCVSHGDGLGNIYKWEKTIGPLESRKPQRNLWGYHQTAGLGYYEYFQFCEDIGAQPVPVVAAGVPCQNSATGGAGQQGGIPMCDMHDYVQDVLNLIEWANGDVKTEWGKKRAEAGHPKPFNLKYIGIGNEDLINDIFEERFTMLFNAVKEKYPDIQVIGTSGPSFEGTDYVEGWKIADKLNVPLIDEHYYQSPGWFVNNHHYYDKYDRSKSKVYLGEYASHLPGRPINVETALSEAHYMTALERNGDVVSMASFAPLLAKEHFTQWNPNLIYFNNAEVKPTVDYYVQKLFGQNSGDEYLNHEVNFNINNQLATKRYASSVVRDTKSGDLIVKLVNYLPVVVKTNVQISGDEVYHKDATLIVLAGRPDDRNAKPVNSNIQVAQSFSLDLPAYSFSVIRISKAK